MLCKMNLIQLMPTTSILFPLCFFTTTAAVETGYPALIVHCGSSLLAPVYLQDEVRRTPTFYTVSGKVCYACPPTNEYERKVNDRWKSRQILFERDLGVSLLRLDQPMPRCESRIRPTVRTEDDNEDALVVYEVGFQTLRILSRRKGVEINDLRENRDLLFNQLLIVHFDGVAGQTISSANSIIAHTFLPTASNVKHNLVYEKNEDVLHTDLDSSYLHFREQILPRMETECSKNPFAHELGIEKIQLVPKDDYILDMWKMVCYLDINTTPVWRVLLMKWNAVEIFVRKIAKMVTNINVETGTTGTLELVEKYYQQNDPPTIPESRLRVPKNVWKIITTQDTERKVAILIIMHNDPFTEHQNPLCVDLCATNGWFVSNEDYRTGIVYCCEVTKQITTQLNSNVRQGYKIFNLTRLGYREENGLSKLLSEVHRLVYDW